MRTNASFGSHDGRVEWNSTETQIVYCTLYRVLSSQPDQEGNKLGSMSGTRVISKSRRVLSSSFFLQWKAPKEIHAILTDTLTCFLPGRAKDLSAPRYLLKLQQYSGELIIFCGQLETQCRTLRKYFQVNVCEHNTRDK